MSRYLCSMKRYKEEETEALASLLKQGEVLAVPTDTVYGLCARIGDSNAKEKLIEIKHRPKNKAFPIMCQDVESVSEVAVVTPMAYKIMHAFMPGPLTVILTKKNTLPEWVCDKETVAIRVATSEALRKMIAQLKEPVFMTSANQSGEKECTTLDEIEKCCEGIGGMMLGAPQFGKASTIVDCTKETPVILREGPITMYQLENALQKNL